MLKTLRHRFILASLSLVAISYDALAQTELPNALETMVLLGYVPETLVVSEITPAELTDMVQLLAAAEQLRIEYRADQLELDAELAALAAGNAQILSHGESESLLTARREAMQDVSDARAAFESTIGILRGVACSEIDSPRTQRLNHAASVLHHGVPAECLVLDQQHEDWIALKSANRRNAANTSRAARDDAEVVGQRALNAEQQAIIAAVDANATVDAARTDLELNLDAMRQAWGSLEE